MNYEPHLFLQLSDALTELGDNTDEAIRLLDLLKKSIFKLESDIHGLEGINVSLAEMRTKETELEQKVVKARKKERDIRNLVGGALMERI